MISYYTELFQNFICPNDPEIIQQLLLVVKVEKLKKGDLVVEAGEIRKEISFLISGIFRGYFIDEKGHEITDCFAYQPGDPVMGCNALNEPSKINMEALADCEVVQIPVDVLTDMMKHSSTLQEVHTKHLLEAMHRQWWMKRIIRLPAIKRYQWFLTNFPGLIELVSPKYVASFLGVTTATLSRVQRQLREENARSL